MATAVGGNPDVLRDGATGRLVPARDPLALAESLAATIEHPEAARAIGREARRDVELRFSLPRMVEAYESLYHGVAGTGRAP